MNCDIDKTNIINLYDNGSIIIKKGVKIYHASDNVINDKIYDNSFFGLESSAWKKKNIYEFKLQVDMKLINTTCYININKDIIIKELSENNATYSLIPSLSNYFNKTKYSKYESSDVDIKKNRILFDNICNKLYKLGYEGMFNYLDSKNLFEIVIFKPESNLLLLRSLNSVEDGKNKKKLYRELINKKKIYINYPIQIKYSTQTKGGYGFVGLFYYIHKQQTKQ